MTTVLQTRTTPVRRFRPIGVLIWLVEADRRYREARKLREMPEFRLRDMGMTREDADAAFQRRFF